MKPKTKTRIVNVNQARFRVTTHDFGGAAEITVEPEGTVSQADVDAFNIWFLPKEDQRIKKPTLVLTPNTSRLVWREGGLIKWVLFHQKPPPFGLN
jgi:hypothetical protein